MIGWLPDQWSRLKVHRKYVRISCCSKLQNIPNKCNTNNVKIVNIIIIDFRRYLKVAPYQLSNQIHHYIACSKKILNFKRNLCEENIIFSKAISATLFYVCSFKLWKWAELISSILKVSHHIAGSEGNSICLPDVINGWFTTRSLERHLF